MVLISSLYPVRDARSWPDKVHDAWLALGLALAGLAWCLAALGLALAGRWPGPWLVPTLSDYLGRYWALLGRYWALFGASATSKMTKIGSRNEPDNRSLSPPP